MRFLHPTQRSMLDGVQLPASMLQVSSCRHCVAGDPSWSVFCCVLPVPTIAVTTQRHVAVFHDTITVSSRRRQG